MRARTCLCGAALAATLAAPPASCEDALTWLQGGIGIETTLHRGGTWTPTGGIVHATDVLTLRQARRDPLTVPERPADLLGLLETEQGRTAAMLLQWSGGDVACGVDLGTVGIDTGLAGFLTVENVTALERYGRAHGGHLYVGPYAEQLDRAMPTIPYHRRSARRHALSGLGQRLGRWRLPGGQPA